MYENEFANIDICVNLIEDILNEKMEIMDKLYYKNVYDLLFK